MKLNEANIKTRRNKIDEHMAPDMHVYVSSSAFPCMFTCVNGNIDHVETTGRLKEGGGGGGMGGGGFSRTDGGWVYVWVIGVAFSLNMIRMIRREISSLNLRVRCDILACTSCSFFHERCRAHPIIHL